MNSKKLKVAVGMSGGVDSGVSAKLLVDAGYDVAGVHLHFWAESDPFVSRENKCCSTESLIAARKTCDMLGIPFYTFNFEDIFKETVVEYFLNEFKSLRTPNPCVVCNRKIKTGRLVKYVQGLGFDMLATGHYINVVQQNGDDFSVLEYDNIEKRAEILDTFPSHAPLFLKMGNDDKKDQSYFLYTMKQEDLVRLVFPLGNMVKDDVRRLAAEWNLPVASSKESFDICFIPGDNYRDFLARHMPEYIVPGDVVTVDGEVIGTHNGLPFYAIGQRRGFTTNKIVPYYVVGFNKDANQLVVGKSGQTDKASFTVHSSTFANENFGSDIDCQVRLRHMGGFTEGRVVKDGENITVELSQPQRGITPGQSAVFYKNRVLLGGGVIDTVLT